LFSELTGDDLNIVETELGYFRAKQEGGGFICFPGCAEVLTDRGSIRFDQIH